jgi:hypothetical protein
MRRIKLQTSPQNYVMFAAAGLRHEYLGIARAHSRVYIYLPQIM